MCAVFGILVSWPGIEPFSPAGEVWSPNYRTDREVPQEIKRRVCVELNCLTVSRVVFLVLLLSQHLYFPLRPQQKVNFPYIVDLSAWSHVTEIAKVNVINAKSQQQSCRGCDRRTRTIWAQKIEIANFAFYVASLFITCFVPNYNLPVCKICLKPSLFAET